LKSRKAFEKECAGPQLSMDLIGGAEADDTATIKARNGEVIAMDARSLQGRDWMLADLVVSSPWLS
jgi:hypothetical protein